MNTVVNCSEPFYGSSQFLDKLYRIRFVNPATDAITFLQHFTLLVIIYSCNIMMYSNSNLRVFYTRTKTNTATNENCKVHLENSRQHRYAVRIWSENLRLRLRFSEISY